MKQKNDGEALPTRLESVEIFFVIRFMFVD